VCVVGHNLPFRTIMEPAAFDDDDAVVSAAPSRPPKKRARPVQPATSSPWDDALLMKAFDLAVKRGPLPPPSSPPPAEEPPAPTLPQAPVQLPQVPEASLASLPRDVQALVNGFYQAGCALLKLQKRGACVLIPRAAGFSPAWQLGVFKLNSKIQRVCFTTRTSRWPSPRSCTPCRSPAPWQCCTPMRS